ncbi:hypothetical protein BGX33_000839, partial [Mortierella sp. NVP41]
SLSVIDHSTERYPDGDEVDLDWIVPRSLRRVGGGAQERRARMEQWGPLIEAERQRDILTETLTTEEEESNSLGALT